MLHKARTDPGEGRLNDQTAERGQTFKRRRAAERRLLGSLGEDDRGNDRHHGRNSVRRGSTRALRITGWRIAGQRIRGGNRVVGGTVTGTAARGGAISAAARSPLATATIFRLFRNGRSAAARMSDRQPRRLVRGRHSHHVRSLTRFHCDRLRQLLPAPASLDGQGLSRDQHCGYPYEDPCGETAAHFHREPS